MNGNRGGGDGVGRAGAAAAGGGGNGFDSDDDERAPLTAHASSQPHHAIGSATLDEIEAAADYGGALPPLPLPSSPATRSTALTLALAGARASLAEFGADKRLVTTLLINVCAVVEKVDEQLLPSVYAFVGASLHATASQLGYLTFSRALVQALASPLGGYFGHYYNRIWVVSGGCLLWSAMTAGFSTCSSVAQGSIFWGVNGIGLSMVIPNSQSLIADYWSEGSRGRAFGMLQLMQNLGGMLGGLWGTNVGAAAPLGIDGWRIAFVGVAVVSLVIALANFAFSREPRLPEYAHMRLKIHAGGDGQAPQQGFLEGLRELRRIVLLPSFLIIILQGVVGSFPWVSLAWATLYLQLIGMSPLAASACYSLFLGGGALGSLLGGALGDWAAGVSPRHGRVAVAQVSVGAGVPMMFVVLKLLPAGGSTVAVVLYGAMFAAMGLTITWCAPACNNPLFAEIVPHNKRTLIYAFDRSFEGAVAAMGAPLVGVMAELYGFTGEAAVSGDAALDMAKARPLGDALLLCTCVPWLLCCLFYTGLHATYWRDKAAALREPGGVQLSVFRRLSSDDPSGPGFDGGGNGGGGGNIGGGGSGSNGGGGGGGSGNSRNGSDSGHKPRGGLGGGGSGGGGGNGMRPAGGGASIFKGADSVGSGMVTPFSSSAPLRSGSPPTAAALLAGDGGAARKGPGATGPQNRGRNSAAGRAAAAAGGAQGGRGVP